MNPRSLLIVTGYIAGLTGTLIAGLVLFMAMGADEYDPNAWTLAEALMQAGILLAASWAAWIGLVAAGRSYPRSDAGHTD